MHTACLVFSQLPDKIINPKFDIEQDVREKLKPFENVLYDYYHFGLEKLDFYIVNLLPSLILFGLIQETPS